MPRPGGVFFAVRPAMGDAAHDRDTSLGGLLSALLPLSTDEAAAVAAGVFDAEVVEDARAPRLPIDAIRVTEDGSVVRTSPPPSTEDGRLDEAALVLRAALPDPGSPTDSPTADLLRHLARGAMGQPGTSIFISASQFHDALRPFSPPDPRAVRRELFERWRMRVAHAAEQEPRNAGEFDGPLHLVDVHVDGPTPWDTHDVDAITDDGRERGMGHG